MRSCLKQYKGELYFLQSFHELWRCWLTNGKYDVKKELKKWFSRSKKVVVAGIGNPIRMDDFVGVKIVQDLREKVSERVCFIECETVPESYIQQIIDFNPSHILLVDAAILGLDAGDARLVNMDQLTILPAFSTHMLPIRIFCEFLAKTTNAKIALLLIEPKATGFGEGLTPEIAAFAREIVESLSSILV
jgi:hydrogenase 3 maturation protease